MYESLHRWSHFFYMKNEKTHHISRKPFSTRDEKRKVEGLFSCQVDINFFDRNRANSSNNRRCCVVLTTQLNSLHGGILTAWLISNLSLCLLETWLEYQNGTARQAVSCHRALQHSNTGIFIRREKCDDSRTEQNACTYFGTWPQLASTDPWNLNLRLENHRES